MPESERGPFQLGIFMPNCSHAYCIRLNRQLAGAQEMRYKSWEAD